jgi:tetratricopeptide (TPR) repeat protein
MEVIIGYVEDLGKDTTTLVSLKDDFVSLVENLEAAAERNDIEEGRAIIEQMKTIVSQFRAEAHALIEDVEEAKAAVQEALEENKDYFDSLLTEARDARRDRNLEVFDLLSARAQGRIDKAKVRGVDVTALQAKLDEIKEKRSELIDVMNDVIAACHGLGRAECEETPEAQAYVTLREDIKSEYRELRDLARKQGRGFRISKALAQANSIISRASERLDRAEARGIDVTVEKAKLNEIQKMVNDAQAKYDAGDYAGAIEDLRAAREAFKTLRGEVRARRGLR